MTATVTTPTITEMVRASRAAQGLPAVVTDPAVLAKLAAILARPAVRS